MLCRVIYVNLVQMNLCSCQVAAFIYVFADHIKNAVVTGCVANIKFCIPVWNKLLPSVHWKNWLVELERVQLVGCLWDRIGVLSHCSELLWNFLALWWLLFFVVWQRQRYKTLNVAELNHLMTKLPGLFEFAVTGFQISLLQYIVMSYLIFLFCKTKCCFTCLCHIL